MFFAKTNPDAFAIGNNLVRVRYNPRFGKEIEEWVVISNDVERSIAFEVDDQGYRKQSELLYQSLRFTESDTPKTLYFGFSSRTDTQVTSISIESEDDPVVPEYGFIEKQAQGNDDEVYDILMRAVISPDDLRRDSTGEIAESQTIQIKTSAIDSGQSGQGNDTYMHVPFIVDNQPPEIYVHSPCLLFDFNGDGIENSEDDLDSNGVVDKRDYLKAYGAEKMDSLISEESETDGISAEDFIRFCDDEDNDRDGYTDEHDPNEWHCTPIYRAEYTSEGELVSEEVPLSFKVTDNVQERVGLGGELELLVYTESGECVYREIIEKPQMGTFYSYGWDFRDTTGSIIQDPDGKYLFYVKCTDAAENTVISDTAYFVVDTKRPSGIEIVKDWTSDDSTDLINSKTESFGFWFRPLIPSDRYDSEAEKLEISFMESDVQGNIYDADPYTFKAFSQYTDLYSTDGQGDRVYQPDGVIDPSTFVLPLKDKGYTNHITDGVYVTEVKAEDAAGNVTEVQDLRDTIVIDREAPILSGYSVNPSFIVDTSELITLRLRISESHDNENNRVSFIGEEFDVKFYLDVKDSLHLITPVESGYSIERTDSVSYLLSADHGFNGISLESKGLHEIIVEVTDLHGNTGTAHCPFFYKTIGCYIASPEQGERVFGDVAVTGNIVDPDESNSYEYSGYRLFLENSSGERIDSVLSLPEGDIGDNYSTREVVNNSLIGYLFADSLDDGDYTIVVEIYESDSSYERIERGIVVDSCLVEESEAREPELTDVHVPQFFNDPSEVLSYSFELADAPADIETEVYRVDTADNTAERVFRERLSSVIPVQGLSGSTDPSKLMIGTDQSENLSFSFGPGTELEMIFTDYSGIESGDVSFDESNDNLSVDISDNRIKAEIPSYDTSLQSVKLSPDLWKGREIVIEVKRMGSYMDCSDIVSGSDRVNPVSNPFVLNTRRSFEWNGRIGGTGAFPENGSYRVVITAQGLERGFDREERDLEFTARPDLAIDTTGCGVPSLIPGETKAFAEFSVNNVCDVSVDVLLKSDPSDIVIDSKEYFDVSSGLIFQWDGIKDNGKPVSLSDEIEFRVVARKTSPAESVSVDIPVRIEKWFDDTTAGFDPLILTGGRKGVLRMNSDSFQVVSGNT
ncbi:MAG: hypothetical protein ACOCSE_04710, partial [Chitinivibrionales bacterium]